MVTPRRRGDVKLEWLKAEWLRAQANRAEWLRVQADRATGQLQADQAIDRAQANQAIRRARELEDYEYRCYLEAVDMQKKRGLWTRRTLPLSVVN